MTDDMLQFRRLRTSTIRFAQILFAFCFLFNRLDAQKDTGSVSFKPYMKVWGTGFGDYYYKIHADSMKRDSAVTQYGGLPQSANAFEFRRVYLGCNYFLSEKFTFESILAYEGQTLSDKSTRGVYIKVADVRWKNIFKGSDLIIGLQRTPAVPQVIEKAWGYRSLERTVIDMRRGASFSDMGIGMSGSLLSNGRAGYDILIANGTGTKIENDIFKKSYGDVWWKNEHLMFDIYGDFERTQLVPGLHRYRCGLKLAAAWSSDNITIGMEFWCRDDHNYVIVHPANSSASILDTSNAYLDAVSVFIRGTIMPNKLKYYVRYDRYDPEFNFHPSDDYHTGGYSVIQHFILAGLDYTPIKDVHLIPNIWYDIYHSRSNSSRGRDKMDFDLVPRITFWYVFM